MFNPPHPGEILRQYTNEIGKSITEIAQGLDVSRKNLSLILNGHGGISAEMAIKLSVALNTTPQFWLNLQKNYDLWQAQQKVDTSRIRHFLEPAA
ncbi:MAG: HigA family addiction module antitoxin [Bacteroidota bacterium]